VLEDTWKKVKRHFAKRLVIKRVYKQFANQFRSARHAG